MKPYPFRPSLGTLKGFSPQNPPTTGRGDFSSEGKAGYDLKVAFWAIISQIYKTLPILALFGFFLGALLGFSLQNVATTTTAAFLSEGKNWECSQSFLLGSYIKHCNVPFGFLLCTVWGLGTK